MAEKTEIVRGRPLFILANNNPCRAAGIIPFYRESDDSISYLVIIANEEIEPFGGKTDMKDDSIENTAIREADEESNRLLKFNKDQLNSQLYFPNEKYMLYFAQMDEKMDASLFGDREFYENMMRTVKWLKYEDIIHYKMKKIDKKLLLEQMRLFKDQLR